MDDLEQRGFVSVAEKNPKEKGFYDFTRDGENIFRHKFSPGWGWHHTINPEECYWKPLNKTDKQKGQGEVRPLDARVMPHVRYSGHKYASDAVRERYPGALLVWESSVEGSDFCIVKDGDGNDLSYGSRSPQKEWEVAWAAHCKS